MRTISVATLDQDLGTEPVARPASCAIDSLIVVARYLGLSLKQEDFAAGSKTGAGAMTDAEIVRRAARCSLRCSPRRVSWSKLVLKRQSLPAVVRFNDGTSMVLLRIEMVKNAPFVVLEDPHANRDAPLVLDRRRFEAVWSGDVLFVRRTYAVIDETVPFSFELIRKLFFRHRRMVGEIVVCTIALSLLQLTPILFMRLVMGRVVQFKAIDTLAVLCVLFLAVIFIETGFRAAKRYVAERLATKVDVRLSVLVFNRLLHLPIEYFETIPAGLTIYRLSLVRRLKDTLLTSMFETTLDVGVLIVFLPIMMLISVPLTLFVTFCFTLTVVWVLLTMPFYRRASGAVVGAETRRGTFLFQTLAGIRTVKTLALDARQRHKWDELVQDTRDLRIVEGRVAAMIEGMSTVLQHFIVLGTMIFGVYLAIQADQLISITTLFTFVLLSQRVASPLSQAANLVQQHDEAYTAVHEIAATVNQPAEDGRSGQGLRIPLQGHVEFDNLRFKYRGAVNPALRSVSFDVPAGMTLGIMGRSGSGKTTITRLLQRLHSDYQGLIKIDGIDIREYDVDHLRASLGVVLQDNFLFSGTIRENITIAKSDASFDEIVQAARLAGADEFIDKLPRGYDTYIYEGSPNLSGGQRQRLAIARALITDPKLLILDEATSALDAESEAIVNANLRRIAEGRTMLVVSHRLASLVNSDAIMVLDRGEVHDIGKHHELLERCDIYSSLWSHQNPTAGSAAA